MIKKVFQAILLFSFLLMTYRLFIKGRDEIPSKELLIDSFVVGTFTSLLLCIFAYYFARKNLIKNGIDPKEFNWETDYSFILKNFNIDTNSLKDKLEELGFFFVKHEKNKYFFKSKMSFWSWGEIIEVDTENFKIRSFSVNPFTIMDFGINRINIERITRKLIS